MKWILIISTLIFVISCTDEGIDANEIHNNMLGVCDSVYVDETMNFTLKKTHQGTPYIGGRNMYIPIENMVGYARYLYSCTDNFFPYSPIPSLALRIDTRATVQDLRWVYEELYTSEAETIALVYRDGNNNCRYYVDTLTISPTIKEEMASSLCWGSDNSGEVGHNKYEQELEQLTTIHEYALRYHPTRLKIDTFPEVELLTTASSEVPYLLSFSDNLSIQEYVYVKERSQALSDSIGFTLRYDVLNEAKPIPTN